MNRNRFPHNKLHLLLLAAILVLLYLSSSNPWASGATALTEQKVYPSSLKYFNLIFIVVATTALIVYFYTLITRRLFWPGLTQFIAGGMVITFSSFAGQAIKAKSLSVLGISQLTIVSTNPESGLTLFFYAGAVLMLTGVVYITESLLRR